MVFVGGDVGNGWLNGSCCVGVVDSVILGSFEVFKILGVCGRKYVGLVYLMIVISYYYS